MNPPNRPIANDQLKIGGVYRARHERFDGHADHGHVMLLSRENGIKWRFGCACGEMLTAIANVDEPLVWGPQR